MVPKTHIYDIYFAYLKLLICWNTFEETQNLRKTFCNNKNVELLLIKVSIDYSVIRKYTTISLIRFTLSRRRRLSYRNQSIESWVLVNV